jgi:hypothetical protein
VSSAVAPATAAPQVPTNASGSSSIQPSRLGPLLYPVMLPSLPDRKPRILRRLVPIMLVPEQRTMLAIRAWQHSAAARSLAGMTLLGQSQAAPMRSGAKSSAGAARASDNGSARREAPASPERWPGSPPCDGGSGTHSSAGGSGAAGSIGGLLPGHRIASSADQRTGRLVARADRARSTSLVSRVEKPG